MTPWLHDTMIFLICLLPGVVALVTVRWFSPTVFIGYMLMVFMLLNYSWIVPLLENL